VINLDPNTLALCTGAELARAAELATPINHAMDAYNINTVGRIAAFLANVGHESGRLVFTTELWGPTDEQKRYERDPNSPWSLRAIDGSKHRNSKAFELGNSEPGDGKRFRGHGLIQTTGRNNHLLARDRLRARLRNTIVPDFVASPEGLAELEWAALSAADFWDMKGLNTLADVGDFMRVVRRINGATNGYAERLTFFERGLKVLPGKV
jgi:putative chitinase